MSAISGEQAHRIRVVLLDADGVMTDGGLYVSADEERVTEGRRFHVHDGLGIHMLRRADLVVAIVSGKVSAPVRRRAEALGIMEVHQVSPFGKLEAVDDILRRVGATWDEAAFLADDLADLPVLREVGLPAAVANAVPEVKEAADWVGDVCGGAGAVREFSEALLRGRAEWDALVEGYVAECYEHWRSAKSD
ncbi:MAG: HAD hydrolase family protein [marine benthic group bacterium]|nr:HAD hydrolase family protein [Gemmatimonadota bacterium]